MSDVKRDAKQIFLEALDLPSPEESLRYVDEVCGDNAELRSRVEALLRAHQEVGDFLGGPPPSSPTVAPPITEKPGTQIGPYKLLEQIGEGGMGVIYMAEQTEPVERRVALKIIKPGMDSRQVIARFEAERQALAMMDHPNIAKVLDAGTTDSGRPYFVMELVNGIPVTQYCDEQHLTAQQRLELFIPICQAVQHAHQKGIIHRDLKPGNILVALYDSRPVPKVIDFGVAKAISQRLTEKTMFTGLGQIVGTLEYMSPEQAQRNQLDIDTRSDVYSLGVVLYELLTGETPFDRQRLRSAAFDEMLRIIREEEPPKPSTRLSGGASLPSVAVNRHVEPRQLATLVRGELDWIVMKALEKDRARRYETASSFAEDVQRYLNDEAVFACPPSAAYKFRKFARRNKVALTTTSVVALTLLLAVGSVGWMVRDRAARQQQAAREREARQTRLAGQVDLILEEVDRLVADTQWPQALAAARRAEAVVEGGETDAATQQRVQQVLADLELVEELEDARLQGSQIKGTSWDWAGAERQFALAFRRAGFKVDGTVDEAVAEFQKRRRILPELAVGLMDWSRLRRKLAKEKDDPRWQHLLAVADAIDPDSWRHRVRTAWKASVNDPNAAELLPELADTTDANRAPAALLVILARSVSNDQALPIWLQAQKRFPADFWVNWGLACCLRDSDPPRLDDAVVYFRVAFALRPGSAAVADGLGQVLSRQGEGNEAIDYMRQAIALDPGYAPAHSNLGLAMEQCGRVAEAIEQYRRAIALAPKHPIPHENLGALLQAQGQLEEAFEHFTIVLDADASRGHFCLGNLLYQQGEVNKAIEHYRQVITLKPKYYEAHNQLGLAVWDQGDLDEAIEHLRQAIELNPDAPEPHVNLGLVLEEQEKLGEASEHFRQAIELDPKDANSHVSLSNALLKLGRPAEAAGHGRQAIALDPHNPRGYVNLGVALLEQGHLDEAAETLRQAIALLEQGHLDEAAETFRPASTIDDDAVLVLAHQKLAWTLYRQRKLKEAIARYRTAIELKPDVPRAHYQLGLALYDQGKLDEAMACYRKAIELDPNAAAAHNNLGAALQKQGKLDEAIACYRKALELDPKHANVRNNLTALCTNRSWQLATAANATERDPAKAVELAKLAIELKPDSPNNWNNLGVAEYRAGHWQAAVDALEKADTMIEAGDRYHRMFLAMAYWQLGDKEKARRFYAEGTAWNGKNGKKSEEHKRFRAEAEELMGIQPDRRAGGEGKNREGEGPT